METTSGTAVITGAASGLGLELARVAAARGLKLVLADVQEDALRAAEAELAARTEVLARVVDVSRAAEVEALGAATRARFGAPTLVFNNAGVGFGGFLWEHSAKDWEWVLGVNLWGVAHGVRVFVPMMLEAARADPAWRGRVVNTASIAGLLNAPNLGVYNVSKHAVVSLSETLYQDLQLVTDQVSASVLCPLFVPTGIHQSHRNRPRELLTGGKPTQSQLVAQAMSAKAVTSGKVSAAEVAARTFAAIDRGQFYIWSHAVAPSLARARLEDVAQSRNPGDPFADRPELGEALRRALRGAS
jgi:NAD(P)-dependent dehydrogenase (short-subunit alcohol dehydrogenase family)